MITDPARKAEYDRLMRLSNEAAERRMLILEAKIASLGGPIPRHRPGLLTRLLGR